MQIIHTNSFEETQQAGQNLARQILATKPAHHAVVLALRGDLGAGKTTFVQGLAKGLGVKEVINSPTFVIMKRFALNISNFTNFYHLDLYRLEDKKDIEVLDLKKILADSKNIIAIEWPEKIQSFLPKNCININFIHRNSISRSLKIDIERLQ